MGVTLTLFSNNTVMNAATMTANVTAIRNWLNGGIATGDIVNGTVKARHLRRLEHYLAENRGPGTAGNEFVGLTVGVPNPRSEGVTGTTLRASITSNPRARRYVAGADSHGSQVWEDVSMCAHRWYAREAGLMEGVFEWWCWAIQSDRTIPEEINACDFRLMLNGTAITASFITLWDSGKDTSAGTAGGPYVYAARNMQAIVQRSVSAGWNNLKLQVKVATHGTAAADRAKYSLVMVGATNLHVEYWMR